MHLDKTKLHQLTRQINLLVIVGIERVNLDANNPFWLASFLMYEFR